MSPDGDCLGSALGLAWAGGDVGQEVACVLARDPQTAERPHAEFCPAPTGSFWPRASKGPDGDCFIAVDVAHAMRLGDGARLHGRRPSPLLWIITPCRRPTN